MLETRPDCASCQGLCCVALPFFASESFPVDKAAGEPCRNLARDHRCLIHASLADRGWTGCTVFDCFGAGQHVSSVTFAGRTWRDDAEIRGEMFDVFGVMHQLFEMLFHLEQFENHPIRGEVIAAIDSGAEVVDVDVAELRTRVGAALSQESLRRRRGRASGTPAYAHRGADLAGRDLRGAALDGADLRGSLLLGADLRGADLAYADLLGADLRGARVDGARLAEALFLSQAQLNATRGDARTTIPARLRRPGGWAR